MPGDTYERKSIAGIPLSEEHRRKLSAASNGGKGPAPAPLPLSCNVCGEPCPVEKYDHLYYQRKTCSSECATEANVRAMHKANAASVAARPTPAILEPNERHRHDGLMRKLAAHSITVEDYNRQLEAQDGTCAICGGPQQEHPHQAPSTRRRLCIDHDEYDTAKRFRALLCDKCNRLIGMVIDCPEWLESARLFLQTH
jgi:hypothetical protein